MRMKQLTALALLLALFLSPVPAWSRGGGGCFLPDSPILRADGSETPISKLRPGDEVLAFTDERRMVRSKVREIIRLDADEYVLLKTDRITLRVTAEHPFYVGRGRYKTVELLREGDTLFAWDGQSITEQRIVSLQKVHERVPVFNLQTDQPNTFFAGHLVVHNKGGGCFAPGTRISTPKGPVPIETLAPGDEVLAVTGDGRTLRTTVKGLFVNKNALLKVRTDEGMLVTTGEHPIALRENGFRVARELQPGDRIVKWKGGRLLPGTVREVSSGDGEGVVFNLEVGEPHTFVAEGIVVHNKGGGCFPTGTPVRTFAGEVPIEKLSPGDTILGVGPDGRIVHSKVEKILATRALVLVVETDVGLLSATADHPVKLSDGGFIPAGELKAGQKVLTWSQGGFREAFVLRASLEAQEQDVYNLSVGWPHTFVASNFVTHNKGGSSSRSSSRSSSGSGSSSGGDSTLEFIYFFIPCGIFILIIVVVVRVGKRGKSENLDFLYGRSQIDRKAKKTEKVLAFLGQQDPSVAPDALRTIAESTFRKLQECWQAREYGPMKPLLMPALFAQHTAQLEGLRRNHEINRIEHLTVEQADLVNVRYTEKAEHREFTALITASAMDHYVDDRTGTFLRGDKTSAKFQEFWTFQLVDGQWVLREIEQSGESDVLKDENFLEVLTDDTMRRIYGEAAGQGAAGPWLEEKTGEKASRIDRLLNFLVQTDKLWNRQLMLDRARQIFLNVYLARESGDVAQVASVDLFREAAKSLEEQMRQWQANGIRAEYRNLCVRKVELILVRNFADRTLDEFTVRIDAHAQKIIRKGDQVMSEQAYVTPFEEYWTLGRLDEQWKLKEVLPPARAKKIVAQENVDEESSPGQLEWYYSQTRAR
jgi:predicted lipid-binding transport protein (Tim44 family)